jgi:hypothetical protein
VISSKTVPELLLVDNFWLLVGFNICIPPICSRSDQLMCYKQNPLSVGALNNLQLLFNCLQPTIGIHWLNRVRECRRLGPLKFSKLVTLLRLWHWLLYLSLLHIHHSLLHSLQHLGLHDQYLLQCWWWRQVGIVVVIVLMSGTIVSVGHLMIVKRFETEIKIEIKDSHLYASRYNDD